MKNTLRGPRIKSERGRGGTVENIIYRNITANNVQEMISFTLNYASGLKPTNESATPKLRNIWVDDVTFVGGSNAGEFNGLKESHIENVTVSAYLSCSSSFPPPFLTHNPPFWLQPMLL